MYSVSSELAAALESQRLHLRVTCGETVLDSEQVYSLRYSASCGGSGDVTVGVVTAASVSLTALGHFVWLDEIITVEVGAEVSGVVQYVPLGTFAIAECHRGEYSTELVGYDASYHCMGAEYVPTVGEDPTLPELLTDIAQQCGLTLAPLHSAGIRGQIIRETVIRTSVIGMDALRGYTCREMAGYIAAIIGYNVLIDRDGAMDLRWFDYCDYLATAEQYYSLRTDSDDGWLVGFVTCTVPVRSTVESQTTRVLREGNGTTGIAIENPFMTQTMLHNLFLLIGGMRFHTGSLSIIGGLLLEPGDAPLVREPGGTSYRLLNQSLELSIDGGCQANIQSSAQAGATVSANISSPIDARFRAVDAQIVDIKKQLSS